MRICLIIFINGQNLAGADVLPPGFVAGDHVLEAVGRVRLGRTVEAVGRARLAAGVERAEVARVAAQHLG